LIHESICEKEKIILITKNKKSVLLFLTIFALSTILVTNNQVKPVSASGGTIIIYSPLESFSWNQTYRINWTVEADSGYKIASVQTRENNVVIRTDYAIPRTEEEEYFTKQWWESNPGLGVNKVSATATFTKDFNFYYETEFVLWDSIGTIYKERFNSIGDWVLSTYDTPSGDPSNNEGYFDSSCTSGYCYVEEDPGITNTYALMIDTGVDLSDWSKYSDIKIKFRMRSTSDSSTATHTNTVITIWGSGGDPVDSYLYDYTDEQTTDTDWVTRTLTLDKDDFSTLTSLTVAFGYQDPTGTDHSAKVSFDFIEVYWEEPP